MSSSGRQLLTLLWKNAKIQQRQSVATVFELLLPLVFTSIVVFVRQSVSSTHYPEGASFLPFSVSMVPYWPTQLAFYPTTEPYGQIMQRAGQLIRACNITTNCTETLPYQIYGFGTEEEMVDNLTEGFNRFQGMDNPWLGAVTFKTNISTDQPITYEIRLSATARNSLASVQAKPDDYKLFNNIVGWQTSLTFPIEQSLGPREPDDIFGGAPGYFVEGFLQIQHAVDMAIIEYLSGIHNLTDEVETLLWRYPYPPYLMDDFILVIQGQLPVLIMMGYVLAVLTVTRNVVIEKEKRLKEFMKVMGLNNWLHWVTHFIWNLGFFLIPVLLLTILLTGSFGEDKVLRESDGAVIFVFLLVYTIAMICFAFCISVFFNKGNTAAAVAGILWFIMYLPYFLMQAQYGALSFAQKMLACVPITTGMGLAVQLIGMWEGQGAYFVMLMVLSLLYVFVLVGVLSMLVLNCCCIKKKKKKSEIQFPSSPNLESEPPVDKPRSLEKNLSIAPTQTEELHPDSEKELLTSGRTEFSSEVKWDSSTGTSSRSRSSSTASEFTSGSSCSTCDYTLSSFYSCSRTSCNGSSVMSPRFSSLSTTTSTDLGSQPSPLISWKGFYSINPPESNTQPIDIENKSVEEIKPLIIDD